ncbi:MAG: radical SAM protein, partial [Pseudomonadota bacterium]
MILLVHPPVVKPCEPPAGIAKLFGMLNHFGVPCKILDANLEGLLSLLKGPLAPNDTWTKRALRNLPGNLASLRTWQAYQDLDRYKRAVKELNRLLKMVALPGGVRLSLANYQHQRLSPVKSIDLIRAAEQPEENPFFTYFKARLLGILEKEQPAVAGFSLNYLSQALCTFAMIGFLRRECPGLKLVLGGGLVTSWMKRPGWQNPFKGLVDYLVAGPGEFHLLSIMGIESNENS